MIRNFHYCVSEFIKEQALIDEGGVEWKELARVRVQDLRVKERAQPQQRDTGQASLMACRTSNNKSGAVEFY